MADLNEFPSCCGANILTDFLMDEDIDIDDEIAALRQHAGHGQATVLILVDWQVEELAASLREFFYVNVCSWINVNSGNRCNMFVSHRELIAPGFFDAATLREQEAPVLAPVPEPVRTYRNLYRNGFGRGTFDSRDAASYAASPNVVRVVEFIDGVEQPEG
jgi:hypothetical protein